MGFDDDFEKEGDTEITGLSMPLNSADSTRISLESIRMGNAGLNAHRQALLNRIPEQETWASLRKGTVEDKDIAYLSAATGDEFALLRGKEEDILYHGTPNHCHIEKHEILMDALLAHKLRLEVHSHPESGKLTASIDDRKFLIAIGQKTSKIISSYTGKAVTFSDNLFDDI